MDWVVEELFKHLEELDELNNTVVFWVSDNGPQLEACEEGGDAGPLRGSKASTWEGGIRMSTFVWWSGIIDPGRTSEQLASTMDIMPTIADILGIRTPQDRVIDGKSLLPILKSKDGESQHSFLYHYCSNSLFAVRHRQYKLHFHTLEDVQSDSRTSVCYSGIPQEHVFHCDNCHDPNCVTNHDPPLIYDVVKDPGEKYPLDPKNHQAVIDLVQEEVKRHLASLGDVEPLFGVSLDASLQPCCNPPCCRCNYP